MKAKFSKRTVIITSAIALVLVTAFLFTSNLSSTNKVTLPAVTDKVAQTVSSQAQKSQVEVQTSSIVPATSDSQNVTTKVIPTKPKAKVTPVATPPAVKAKTLKVAPKKVALVKVKPTPVKITVSKGTTVTTTTQTGTQTVTVNTDKVKVSVTPNVTPTVAVTDPNVIPCPDGYPKIDTNTGLASVCYKLDTNSKYSTQIPDWNGFKAPTLVFNKILSCTKSEKKMPMPFSPGFSWVWTLTPQFNVINGNYVGGYNDPSRPMTSLYKLGDIGHYTYTINAYTDSVSTDVDHADISITFQPFNWFQGVIWASGYQNSKTITYHLSSPISAKDCS